MQRLILPFLFLVSLKLALHSSQKSYSGNTATAEIISLNTRETIFYNRQARTIRFPASLFGFSGNTWINGAMCVRSQDEVRIFGVESPGLAKEFTLFRDENQYSGEVSINGSVHTLIIIDKKTPDGDRVPEFSDTTIAPPPLFDEDLPPFLRATNGITLNWQVTASNACGNRYSFTGLPPGLTWTNSGRIDGAPQLPGTYWATVTASNFSGASHRDLDIFVLPRATNLPWSDEFTHHASTATNYLIVPEGSGTFTSANSRLTFSSPANTNATNSGNFVKAFPNLQLSLPLS